MTPLAYRLPASGMLRVAAAGALQRRHAGHGVGEFGVARGGGI